MQSVMEKVDEVPVMPVPPPEPKRDRKGALKWGAIGLGALIVLGGIGASVGADKAEPKAQKAPQSVQDIYDGLEPGKAQAPAEGPALEIGVAAAQSMPYTDTLVEEMTKAGAAANSLDVEGAAMHTERGADAVSAISGIWAGVDDHMSTMASDAAFEMYQAADDMRAYRIDSATRHMNAANALVQEMTSYGNGLA